MKSHWIHGVILGGIASLASVSIQAAGDQVAVPAATTPVSGMTTADSAKKAGEKFMQENKTKPGVVTLPSGLQYQILDAGSGKKPGKNDTVTVDYEGTLLSGQIFDSSYERGQPASFGVNQVIPGWTEALQMMDTGATWMLYIPPELAYGKAGAGGAIGPNETLVFKVHLISIKE